MAQYVKDEMLMWLWHSHVTGCVRSSIVETAYTWPKFTDTMMKTSYALLYGFLESTDRDKSTKQNRKGGEMRRRIIEDILDISRERAQLRDHRRVVQWPAHST